MTDNFETETEATEFAAKLTGEGFTTTVTNPMGMWTVSYYDVCPCGGINFVSSGESGIACTTCGEAY